MKQAWLEKGTKISNGKCFRTWKVFGEDDFDNPIGEFDSIDEAEKYCKENDIKLNIWKKLLDPFTLYRFKQNNLNIFNKED